MIWAAVCSAAALPNPLKWVDLGLWPDAYPTVLSLFRAISALVPAASPSTVLDVYRTVSHILLSPPCTAGLSYILFRRGATSLADELSCALLCVHRS